MTEAEHASTTNQAALSERQSNELVARKREFRAVEGGMGTVVAWHGTDREFMVPHPLTHFGTREAALTAPRFRGVLMKFALTPGHILEVPDSPGGADLWTWARSAADREIVSEEEFVTWERTATDDAFAQLLRAKGYDTLVYQNDYEDAGSRSWVILDRARAIRLYGRDMIEHTVSASF